MGAILASPLRQNALLAGTWKNLFYPPERDEYTYFKRAKDFPFASGNTYVKAAWAADAATLAYGRFGKSAMPPREFEDFLKEGAGFDHVQRIGDWSKFGTQAYFACNNQLAILSFRGTEADDPLDSLADLDILLVDEHDFRPAPDEAHLALRHLALIDELSEPRCQVHQGFQRALNGVWNEVHGCVSDFRNGQADAEICFTGHSLGAALATLAFSRFDDPKMSLYTFGCPRVGNKVAITGLPRAGIFLFPNSPAPGGLVDHSPGRYCVRLWNCV